MKRLTLFLAMVVSGCVASPSGITQIAKDEYRIVVRGPIEDGKERLRIQIYTKAIGVGGATKYQLARNELGKTIAYSGESDVFAQGDWHGKDTRIIEAVATVQCMQI